MKALFIAGEASGDLHASNLITALKKQKPEIEFFGIGGEKMEDAGTQIIYPYNNISVVGFSEVLSKISKINEAKRQIAKCVRQHKFDFAVTIDFPGFNISLARFLHNMNIPVFYFITPQVWAWGKWRCRSLAKNFEHLFVIYPFEKNFLQKEKIPSSFLGNPLLDTVKPSGNFKKKDLPVGKPLIAILPGSRKTEITRLLEPMLKAFMIFKDKYPDSQAVVSLHDKKDLSLVKNIVQNFSIEIKILYGKTHDILKHADLAIVSSGTATVEAGLLKTPMVIVYRTSFITYFIGKALVKIPHIGLINIVAGSKVVPELLQNDLVPEKIASYVDNFLQDNQLRDNVKKKLIETRKKLGVKGASKRAAQVAIEMLNRT